VPRQQKGVALPSWPAWPLHRSDLGQSRAVAQQLAREGPALRDVQATPKVSPRLGVVRWHGRVPRRSRTIKREADEERMAMKRLRTTWTSQMHLATRSGSTESFVRMTESRGELDAK
jgi:predicted secreted hydrolase